MIDSVDQKILQELQQDARLSSAQLAKRTKIPQTTVHYRLRRMEKEKIIKGYTVKIDYEKIGRAVMGYVLVLFDTAVMKQNHLTYANLAQRLQRIPGVEDFAYTSGQYDIIIRVTASTIKELSSVVLEQLRLVPGVLRTESLMVMDYFEAISSQNRNPW